MPAQVSKRERLVTSAAELSHTDGFSNSSLSAIAERAGLAPGDTYYYFRTRASLAAAVVERRCTEYAGLRRQWDAETTPQARLEAFIRHTSSTASDLAAFGCPVGGLCVDLGRVDPDSARLAGQILSDTIEWAQHQFDSLDGSISKNAGSSLVARMQGAAVIANATQDPRIVIAQCQEALNELVSLTVSSTHH